MAFWSSNMVGKWRNQDRSNEKSSPEANLIKRWRGTKNLRRWNGELMGLMIGLDFKIMGNADVHLQSVTSSDPRTASFQEGPHTTTRCLNPDGNFCDCVQCRSIDRELKIRHIRGPDLTRGSWQVRNFRLLENQLYVQSICFTGAIRDLNLRFWKAGQGDYVMPIKKWVNDPHYLGNITEERVAEVMRTEFKKAKGRPNEQAFAFERLVILDPTEKELKKGAILKIIAAKSIYENNYYGDLEMELVLLKAWILYVGQETILIQYYNPPRGQKKNRRRNPENYESWDVRWRTWTPRTSAPTFKTYDLHFAGDAERGLKIGGVWYDYTPHNPLDLIFAIVGDDPDHGLYHYSSFKRDIEFPTLQLLCKTVIHDRKPSKEALCAAMNWQHIPNLANWITSPRRNYEEERNEEN